MKKFDSVIREIAPALKKSELVPSRAASTQAGAAGKDERSRAHEDAIIQIFAEFELAYHNQFHKAFGQANNEGLAKKYWLNCLREFTPEVIVRAARHLINSQEYLPSVAAMVAACENAFSLFGLPPVQAAYTEACCAREPRHAHPWSHPAVYLAGQATGWFELASETPAQVLPVFEYHYHQLCQRVVRGESLEMSVPKALPAGVSVPLSPEENKARLKILRERFDL